MKFERWVPIDFIPETLYLEALYDDYEGFRLLLRGHGEKQKMLRIAFDPPLSYRNTDEGDLLKSVNNADLGGWSLYTVTDSEYLRWFHDESCGIHEAENVLHYAIYTPNDCLDVLAAFPPSVEWLS